MTTTSLLTFSTRPLLALFLVTALASTGATNARAFELIPSFGLTKSTATNAGDAQRFGGLAVRIHPLPLLKLEGGVGYRQDSPLGGAVKVHQWPVTASLWLSPAAPFYVGGGVGWYHTTLDYPSALPIQDSTSEKLGVHLGGGVVVPVTPGLGLDLNARYIFLSKDKATFDVPTTFSPDFWSMTLGLAISY